MDESTFSDAQLAQLRAIVRDELAAPGADATAPEPTYRPIVIHFRDGTRAADYELEADAYARLFARWAAWTPVAGQHAPAVAYQARYRSSGRPCMLCFGFADVLYIS